jgi:hypothetical protein
MIEQDAFAAVNESALGPISEMGRIIVACSFRPPTPVQHPHRHGAMRYLSGVVTSLLHCFDLCARHVSDAMIHSTGIPS